MNLEHIGTLVTIGFFVSWGVPLVYVAIKVVAAFRATIRENNRYAPPLKGSRK